MKVYLQAATVGYRLRFGNCHCRFMSLPLISHRLLPYITPSTFTIGTILKIYLFSNRLA